MGFSIKQVIALFAASVFLIPNIILGQNIHEAITFPNGFNLYAIGYLNYGVGWTFTPTANLKITSLGFYDTNSYQVDIWQSTNQPIATYLFPNIGSPQTTNYQSIAPLTLTAGQNYGITLNVFNQRPGTLYVRLFWEDSTHSNLFAVSPYLNGFESYFGTEETQWSPSGESPFNQSNVIIGPTFKFEVIPPVLNVAFSNSNVMLAWPTNISAFQLQSTPSIGFGADWQAVTNSPSVLNETNIVILPIDSTHRFFRLSGP